MKTSDYQYLMAKRKKKLLRNWEHSSITTIPKYGRIISKQIG